MMRILFWTQLSIYKKKQAYFNFFDATGILHHNNSMPEKTFKNIEFEFVKKIFDKCNWTCTFDKTFCSIIR